MVYIYKGICYMYGRTNKNSIKRESNAVKILLKNFLRKKKIKKRDRYICRCSKNNKTILLAVKEKP